MICDQCGHRSEYCCSFRDFDSLPSVCPGCEASGYRQDYSGERASNECVFVKDITTVGQLAEANNKKLGKELIQKKIEKLDGPKKKKTSRPWWRKTDKPLDTRKIKDLNKYIMTGEK